MAFSNRTKRGLLYGTALTIALMLLFPFAGELFLNSSSFRQKVAALAARQTGVRIDPGKIRFQIKTSRFYPILSVGIGDTDLSLSSSLRVHIKAIYVDLDTPSLLLGKIVPRGIQVDTPDLLFSPDSGQSTKKSPAEKPFWLTGIDPSIQQIQRLFDALPDTPDEFDLALNRLKSKYFKSMNGTVSVSRSEQVLTLDLNIQGLRIPRSEIQEIPVLQSMYLKTIGSETVRFVGRLSTREGIDGNLKFGGFYMEPERIPGKTIFLEQVEAVTKISDHSWSVELKPIAMTYPQGRAGLSFTHAPATGKSGISFFGSGIDIEQARQVCLALGSDSHIVSQLFDILRQGKTGDVLVSFESQTLADLFDVQGMVIKGTVQRGMVKIPKTELLAGDIQGRAFIQKGILQINAETGTVNGSTFDSGWLEIDLLNHENTPFQGEFHLLTDLSGLPETLISLLPDTSLARELKKVHDVSGQGEARLILGMPPGDGELNVKVFAKEISASGTYERIPLPLQITGGTFSYEDDRIILTDLSGTINGNPIDHLSAQAELSGAALFTVSAGRAELNAGDFIDWIKASPQVMKLISPVQSFSGLVNIGDLNIKGPFFHPQQWTFRVQGFSRNMELGFPSPMAVRRLNANFDITDKSCHVNTLQADVDDLSWLDDCMGSQKVASISTPLKVVLNQVDLSNAKNRINGRLRFLSGTTLDFALSGKSMASLTPINISLKDGDSTRAELIFSTDSTQRQMDFKGIFHSQTLEKILKENSHLHHSLRSFTGGAPFTIYKDDDLIVHGEFESLLLDPLLVQGEQSSSDPGVSFLFPRNPVRISAKHLVYKKLNFSDLQASMAFTPENGTAITLSNLNLCDLQGSGSARISRAESGPAADMGLHIQASEKENVTPMLSCLFKEKRLAEGPYSFSCDLTGKGPMSGFSKNLNGKLSFQSKDGRIYKATLLSRILSVINILSLPDLAQEGFAYRSFDVQGEIKEGVIHLDKALIDGENMAMTFTGWIDPFEDKMDLTCLVAPFKTIDTIIKYIPIINTALQGRLVSFPAKIQGSLKDPVVTPLHPSAVGEGLINMMGDILKTPIRLLKGTP